MSTSKKVTRRRKPIVNGHYRGIPEKAQEKIDQKKKRPRPKKKRPSKKTMLA